MKAISPLRIAIVLLALSSLFHLSSTETVHGNSLQLYSVHN
ncbi:hypothetical protein HU200_065854 [Digitaria exilis]|uniref:Uncharacterized protein n=1 Tax=Digitaria exilis TaxID=1010633 RepID=A0A834ZZB2_9POAL|nr:hypothetical protein HU200_065854 [Digitaria exilis]